MKSLRPIVIVMSLLLLTGCTYTPRTQYMNYSITERQKLEHFADQFFDTHLAKKKGQAKKLLSKSYTFGDHMTVRVYRMKRSSVSFGAPLPYTSVWVLRTDNVKNKRKYMVRADACKTDNPFTNYQAKAAMKHIIPKHKALKGKAPNAKELALHNASFQNELYRKMVADLEAGNKPGMLEQELLGGLVDADWNFRYRFFDANGKELGQPTKGKILHAHALLSNKRAPKNKDTRTIAVPVSQNLYCQTETTFIGIAAALIGQVYDSFCYLARQPWKWYAGFLFLLGAVILTIVKSHIKEGYTSPLTAFILLTLVMSGCLGLLKIAPWYTLGVGKIVFSVILIITAILFIYNLVFIIQTTIHEGVVPALIMLVAEGLALTGSIIASPIVARITIVSGIVILVLLVLGSGGAVSRLGGAATGGGGGGATPDSSGGYEKGDSIFWNGEMWYHNGDWGDMWKQ